MTKSSASIRSTALTSFSRPMVEADAPDGVAAQKLPNPCVGQSRAPSGSRSDSRRAEACWWRARVRACSAPSRSVRPVPPNNSEPPVNTPSGPPGPAST